MKVLLTGGTGFIGQHLLRRLLRDERVSRILVTSRLGVSPFVHQDNQTCSEVACDISREKSVYCVLKDFKPDIIFHLAGHAIVKEDGDPTRVTRTNILGTHNLLAHCPEGCRFVLASSATVYGDRLTPMRETHEIHPTSAYGASKAAAELLLEAYADKVSGLSLRLVANVGHGTTHGVLKDVVAKLRSDSVELELIGNEPGSLKPFIHVSDTVEAFMHFGFNPAIHWWPINISTPDSITVLQLALASMNAMGVQKPIRWLGAAANWKGDNPVVRVNADYARQLGWSPRYKTSCEAVAQATREMMHGN